MNLSKTQVIIIGAIGLVVLFFILIFLGVIPGLKKPGATSGLSSGSQTQINFWGVDEGGDSNAIQAVIDEYSKIDKSVSVIYRRFSDSNDYEKTLLDALASGQAPDIFMFHSSWLPKHYAKVSPLSETSFPLSELQSLFPQVVEQDFSMNGKTYALPLYIDTLALIYNKDIFNAYAVTSPPQKWADFEALIPQLRQMNGSGQITRAAAAIGGSEKSVHSSSDLLNLLILQFLPVGGKIIDAYNQANFGSEALSAFNFYLQFANPSDPNYTWNDNLAYSLDGFSQGQTAMIFDYASQIPLLKAKNPNLNLAVGPMPQFYDSSQSQLIRNYAGYWGMAVSNQSKKIPSAWNFILYATANPNASEIFLKASQKPPALLSLIEKYKNDPAMGIFARQALTARSWPQPDSSSVKQIFSDMIQSVLNGRLNSRDALEKAQNEVNALK